MFLIWEHSVSLVNSIIYSASCATMCLVGRKVSILKVHAQSCLYDMLKSDILATFWHIAFENPFNGD